MNLTNKKKHEYWNHWINYIFVECRSSRPSGVTGAKLHAIKDDIWQDANFWQDTLMRHDGHTQTPEQMMQSDHDCYQHMIGNFTGMVTKALWQKGFIK